MANSQKDPDRPIKIIDLLLVHLFHGEFISMMRDLGHDDNELREYLRQDELLSELVQKYLNVTFSELQRIGVQDPDDLIIRMACEQTSEEEVVRSLRDKYFGREALEKSSRAIH